MLLEKNYSKKSFYILLMFFIAYTFKGQVHAFAGENFKLLVLQDKCNIEIFLSPGGFISNYITSSNYRDVDIKNI